MVKSYLGPDLTEIFLPNCFVKIPARLLRVPLQRDWRCYFVRRTLWRHRLQRQAFPAIPAL